WDSVSSFWRSRRLTLGTKRMRRPWSTTRSISRTMTTTRMKTGSKRTRKTKRNDKHTVKRGRRDAARRPLFLSSHPCLHCGLRGLMSTSLAPHPHANAIEILVRAHKDLAANQSGTGIEGAVVAELVVGQNLELVIGGQDVGVVAAREDDDLVAGEDGRAIHVR